MKKISKLLVLTALLLGWTLPSWSQASTQGKEFWVALGLSDNGDTEGSKEYYPFIAISTKEECNVTISNPSTGWRETKHLDKNVWAVARTNPTDKQKEDSGYMFEIPAAQWYPQDAKENNYAKANEKAGYNLGLLVSSDKDISVFAAMRQEYAYDASNILPSNTLQYDYITQDYPPSQSNSYITILATEDGTHVEYTLGGNTQKSGHDKGTTQTVTLSKGQVWYLVSRSETESLSGTHITADKKIAVFNGNVFTRIPGSKSARDCLYEQAMPTDYWGTEFVVTRSMKKDANRVRITAMENGTSIEIDGQSVTTLDAYETFEFEMSDNMGTPGAYSGLAHYIKTYCPVAVYSYDVSSKYTASSSEADAQYPGDPSMVWIAPLEQHISEITFGACGTKDIKKEGKTPLHYVNIVCLTADAASFKLKSEKKDDIPVTFTQVPGNTTYSYARTFLVNTDDNDPDKVFTMSCPSGLIAQIYGNGYNESYAYSVGSSAVSLGTIAVGDQVFQDGDVSKKALCVNEELLFDATAGTTIIDKVEWDFGDGVTETITEGSRIHKYTSPGWYKVTAQLYAHKDCPQTTYPPFGVHFRFYVNRPDTIHHVQYEDEGYEGAPIETKKYDCDSVVVIHHEIIKTCLNLQIPENKQVCNGEDLEIPFSYPIGGKHGKAYLCKVIHDPSAESGYHLDTLRDQDVDIKGDVVRVDARNVDTLTLPISTWDPGKYTVCILMEDSNCTVKNEAGEEFPTLVQSNALYITVKYPADIIAFKFNNVLAVYQNKGYEFEAYQWYQNDAKIDPQKNPSATTSVYHTEEVFTPGDEYYVMLTEKGKEPVPSCTFTVPDADELDNYEPNNGGSPEDAPKANKKIVNSRICVEFDGRTYDMYGQRVK